MTKFFKEVGLQDLSVEERTAFEDALVPLGLDAPIVGALRESSSEEEMRLLVLYEGITWMLRMEPIPVMMAASAIPFFTRLSRVHRDSVRAASKGGMLLYARKYFKEEESLSFALKSTSENEKLTIFNQIFTRVEEIHSERFFHGHLTFDNLMCVKGSVYLVDVGVDFFCTTGRYADIAVFDQLVLEGQRKDVRDLLALCLAEYPALEELLPSDIGEVRMLRELFTSSMENLREKKVSSVETGVAKHTSSRRLLWMPLFLITLISGAVAIFFSENTYLSFTGVRIEKYDDLYRDWLSGIPSQVERVALLAGVQGDENAQRVILNSREEAPTRLKSQFLLEPLKIAAHAGWYEEFSSEERRILFALALAPILKERIGELPSLTALHYGVALALLGGLPESQSPLRLYQLIEPKKQDLPYPYGGAVSKFSAFSQLQGASLFRLLILMRTTEVTRGSLENYIPMTLVEDEIRMRIELLLPDLSSSNKGVLWSYLLDHPGARRSIGWFMSDSLADWSEMPPERLLDISYISEDFSDLSAPQLGDLLVAPFLDEKRREALVEQILARMGVPALSDFFRVLSGSTDLTRDQVVTLLSGLMIDSDSRYAFMSKWFETNPEPQSIISLLVACSDVDGFDYFSLPASQYLRDKKGWMINSQQLERLTRHVETLARGLAYTRADINDPIQRKLLRGRYEEEQSTGLKKILRMKLFDDR